MSGDFLKTIHELEQFAVATTRQEYFRKLRDAERSDVIDNFFSIMSAEDPTINKTTGKKHTVESLVQELQARVCLDTVLQKQSTNEFPPLSRKAKHLTQGDGVLTEQDLVKRLEEFSKKYFLERDHGMSSVETIIEEFKMQPDGVKVIEVFGREKIRDVLQKIIDSYPKDDMGAAMPASDAIVMPSADRDHGEANERSNVGMGGSPGVTTR